MKKEKPMLFSTPMVIAIDNNSKTETRRTRGLESINSEPDYWKFSNIELNPREYFGDPDHEEPKLKTLKGTYAIFYDDERGEFIKCPYGNIGDKIWVRETFEYSDDLDNPYWYKAIAIEEYNKEHFARMKWRPCIHMPKEAARIWLEIVDIRIERLQDISEKSSVSEGVENLLSNCYFESSKGKHLSSPTYRNYIDKKGGWDVCADDAIHSFKTLWYSINGKESWEQNPWVWVIEFKKCKK